MAGLVHLGTFNVLAEAQIAKSMLEAHDIPVFLFDEHLGGTRFSLAVLPGFRLMVPEDCLEEASGLLATKTDPSG